MKNSEARAHKILTTTLIDVILVFDAALHIIRHAYTHTHTLQIINSSAIVYTREIHLQRTSISVILSSPNSCLFVFQKNKMSEK